jgi:hypothetical protein
MVAVGDGWASGSALAVGCMNRPSTKTNSSGMVSASRTSVLAAMAAGILPGELLPPGAVDIGATPYYD